jgi:hypothetical protein
MVPKPSVPPSERLPSRRWSRRTVRRCAQRVGAPSAPVASAGQSVDRRRGPKGLQHPPKRASGRAQRVQWGPRRPRSAAAHGVCCGW